MYNVWCSNLFRSSSHNHTETGMGSNKHISSYSQEDSWLLLGQMSKIWKNKNNRLKYWHLKLILVISVSQVIYEKQQLITYNFWWNHHPDITKTMPMTLWLCCWQIIGQENTTKQTVQCTIRNLTSYEIHPNENYCKQFNYLEIICIYTWHMAKLWQQYQAESIWFRE